MRRLILSTALVALAGCTGPDFSDEYRPIVDYQASLHRGVNYEADLDVCDVPQEHGAARVAPQDDPEMMTFWTALMWVIVASVSALLLSLFHVLLAELRKREAALHELTRTDALTGLYNRRHFMQQMTHEHARATRYGRPLSCVMVDLDHFKRINDEHGHAVGDEVLRETALRLRRALRETDVLARLGGEEFGALLPDTDLEGAQRVAERCRELLGATPVQVEHRPSVRVTASFGVAVLDAVRAPGPEDLLRAADMALYASKSRGRIASGMPTRSSTAAVTRLSWSARAASRSFLNCPEP